MTTQQPQYTLKEARTLLDMSKRDLSKASGISIQAINAVENGSEYRNE